MVAVVKDDVIAQVGERILAGESDGVVSGQRLGSAGCYHHVIAYVETKLFIEHNLLCSVHTLSDRLFYM